jgi:hypothetical protein
MTWIILGVYALGVVVAQTLLKRHWYGRFGVEFEGFVWALFGALLWPAVAALSIPLSVLYGVYRIDRRRA